MLLQPAVWVRTMKTWLAVYIKIPCQNPSFRSRKGGVALIEQKPTCRGSLPSSWMGGVCKLSLWERTWPSFKGTKQRWVVQAGSWAFKVQGTGKPSANILHALHVRHTPICLP